MTRKGISFSPLSVLFLSLLLGSSTAGLVAQEDSGIDVTLKLRGGMAMQCRLLTPSVAVETDYGTLNVPTDQILIVYNGSRADAALEGRIKKYIDDFRDNVFEVRDEAQAELTKIGAPAIPYLQAVLDDDDAEVADRAAATLEAIRKSGFATASPDDTVVAKRFTIVGRITSKEYEISSPLGTTKVAIEKVAGLATRPLNVPTVLLPAQLNTRNGTEPYHWKASLSEEVGWTGVAFDDTKWGLATVPYQGYLGCTGLQIGETCCLRRTFILDAPPAHATLQITASASQAYVNGISIGKGENGVHDVTRLLRQGINVVAIKAVGFDRYAYACTVSLDIK